MVFICGVIMATTKAEFQDLAAELIDDEFAEMRYPLVFTISTGGSFNPVTGQTTGGTTTTYSYMAVPRKMRIEQWQGYDIAATDQPVTYTITDNFIPSVEQTCTYDGVPYQVVVTDYDKAANAAMKLVLRAL